MLMPNFIFSLFLYTFLMPPPSCELIEMYRLTEGYGTAFAFAPDNSRWMSCYTGVGYLWEGNSIIRTVPLPEWIDGSPAYDSGKGFFCGTTQIHPKKKTAKSFKKISALLAPDKAAGSRVATRILYTGWVIPGEQLLLSTSYAVPRNANPAPEYSDPKNRLLLVDVGRNKILKVLGEGSFPFFRTATGNKWIAAVSDQLDIWDPDGKKFSIPSDDQTLFTQTSSIQFSPQRNILALSFENGSIQFFWGDSMEHRSSWQAHERHTTSIAFHPTLPILASADDSGVLRFWNIKNPVQPSLVCSSNPDSSGIDALAFRPDGTLLVASRKGSGQLVGYSLPFLSE